MSGIEIYALGATVLLLAALAWGMFAKSQMHGAKAEVYQEFADTFRQMGASSWIKDKERKKREKQRAWMRLCLCDPLVCDGLRGALADADEHWKHLNKLEERLAGG